LTELVPSVALSPLRRVWIAKPGKVEQRPLGIPVMADRAAQALVKLALEPEWEAKFEPNSYGYRPGRSCHNAIEAIFEAESMSDYCLWTAQLSLDPSPPGNCLARTDAPPRCLALIPSYFRLSLIFFD
jgi:RNA-directed DNA polymerase